MEKLLIPIIFVLAVVLIIVSQSMYTVDQTRQAILLQLGQPVGNADKPESFFKQPGLHFKIPIAQSVQYFDRRILSVDPAPEQVVISSAVIGPAAPQSDEANKTPENAFVPSIENVTGEPIIVDTFARYKIVDPIQFLKTLRTISGANSRIESILKDATKSELGKTSLQELLSPVRTTVMNNIRERVNLNVKKDKLGIQIVDVRIVRADLTPQLLSSTVKRMKSELSERAAATRANGEKRAKEIRSTAEKERTIILAEAQRDSEILKGQGDNEAITIYANAFNKDKEFYSFIRSMDAYKNTLSNPETQLILSPDSKFFKYFENTR